MKNDMEKKIKCPYCNKPITAEEYNVNWGSCLECFKKFVEGYEKERTNPQ